RHTRWPRDWSSDVCSSDLVALAFAHERTGQKIEEHQTKECLGKYHVSHIHASALDLDDVVLRKMFFYAATPTLIIVDEAQEMTRSEERRVGKECRSEWLT